VLNFQTGKRDGGVDELEEEHEEAQQMQAAAADVISFVYMRQLNNDVLSRLFKLREYLKVRGDETSIKLAKACHTTIL
jgi:3-dehydroquinate dehydratase